MILRLIPIVLASLLLAAHFLRDGNLPAVAASALAPGLLFVRRRWSLVVLQIVAYGAAALWVVTLAQIVQERQMLGRPYAGVIAILGTVAAFSVMAGLLLNTAAVRARYPR